MSQVRVDVLIVVALRDELDAMLAQGGGATWRAARDSGGAIYYERDDHAQGHPMRLALAWLGGPGQGAATMRSRRLIDELDPMCIAMCGVCAGRRGRVQPGDVIVADRVVDLGNADSGGAEHTGSPVVEYELDFAWKTSAADLAADLEWRESMERLRPPSMEAQTRWLLHMLSGAEDPAIHSDRASRCPAWPDVVRRALDRGDAQVAADGTLALTATGRAAVRESVVLHPDGPPGDPPFGVHIGALGTAARMLREDDIAERSALTPRGLLGVDLESSAVASVALHLGRKWLVVKGVVDLAGPEKDDTYFAFAAQAAASFLTSFLRRYVDVGARTAPASDKPLDQVLEPMFVEQLTIVGFKNIGHISLDLTGPSKLPGRWTCLAGINGAGKTSILQAMVLALLGDKLSEQLGSIRLARMVRQAAGVTDRAEITTAVRVGAEVHALSLPLSGEGIDSSVLARHPGIKEMRAFWEKRARRGILAAYGASRNLSEYLDNRHESLHLEVQRQMTLFDPQARVVRADRLLSDDPQLAPVIRTLRSVLGILLADLPIQVASDEASLRFEIGGAVLPASALPDGFRSTVAWLGDLCALWHEKALPEEIGDGAPQRVHGVVLIDEIDLHLHPTLQRVLVPRLRESMPRVQWIVTTHSPLVLASFDRHEIKVLDADHPGGVRELDRDILGFTTDQIYDWLMGTTPRGIVLEEMLARADSSALDPAQREEIAVLVATAPDFSDEEAKKRVAWRQDLVARLRRDAAPGDQKQG
jgi:nucleoside phosphorylase